MINSRDKLSWEILNERLEAALTGLLLTNGHHYSEYQLIKTLIEEPFELFNSKALRANLALFQTHFILFHVLYKLKRRWLQQQQCWLHVSPLVIGVNRWVAFEKLTESESIGITIATAGFDSKQKPILNNAAENKTGDTGESGCLLSETDPVAEYYLDLANLSNASEYSVDNLLKNFWHEYLHPNQKRCALEILQCSVQDGPEKIKSAYRKLAMIHHPDRGGDASAFAKIQDAYQLLKIY